MLDLPKRIVKRMLRPFARPVLSRVDIRVQSVRDDVVALRTQLDALLDASASLSASAHEARYGQTHIEGQLGALRDRVEFIRTELMYEMRYGARRTGDAAVPTLEPRIVAADRLASMSDLRVNLGCGHITLPGFVNVDRRELDNVDVVADVRNLPFPPGSLAQIHSAHLLEHFPIEEVHRSLLPYWISMLRPGGLLTAIVPDTETMISEFSAGRMTFEELRLVIFGQQEYDQDFHFNMFSGVSMCELLRQAGLVDVRMRASGRRNGVSYEMEVEGRRPAAPQVTSTITDASTASR